MLVNSQDDLSCTAGFPGDRRSPGARNGRFQVQALAGDGFPRWLQNGPLTVICPPEPEMWQAGQLSTGHR